MGQAKHVIAAVFPSAPLALRAVGALVKTGVPHAHIDLLMPGDDPRKLDHRDERDHADKIGSARFGLLGGGLGALASFPAAAIFVAGIPGLGMAFGIGAIAASLLGGAAAGKSMANAAESSEMEETLRGEKIVAMEAIKRGEGFVAVRVHEDTDLVAISEILRAAGGETPEEASERWSMRAEDANDAHHDGLGRGPFRDSDPAYQRGLRAGIDPKFQGRSFEEVAVLLRASFSDAEEPAFRAGYERATWGNWESAARSRPSRSSVV